MLGAFGTTSVARAQYVNRPLADASGPNSSRAETFEAVASVATLAALKALAVRPATVVVLGRTSIDDGGGGLFYWVAGDTTSADDALVVQCAAGPEGRYKRLEGSALTPQHFGAVGDGVANDTAAVQAFLDALRDGGVGDWTGTFLVDAGVLSLSPSPDASFISSESTLRLWRAPQITGDAILIFSGTGSGPILSVRIQTQTTSATQLYAGGRLGNLSFLDNSGSTILTRHGLFVEGLGAWEFGIINGFHLAGSLVYFSRRTVSGNTDPYGVYFCVFRSVRAEYCNGPAWNADIATDNGNYVLALGAGGMPRSGTADPLGNGAMVTCGQGTAVLATSTGGYKGWAVKYGDRNHPNRQVMWDFSLGAGEYGIWVATCHQFHLAGRLEGMTDAANVTGSGVPSGTEVWPKTCLKIGGSTTGGGLSSGRIDYIMRIDEGTLSMLGPAPFLDMSNDPNIGDLEINITIFDEARMGLLDRHGRLAIPVTTGPYPFVANLNPVAGVVIKVNGFAVVTNHRTTAIRTRLAPSAGGTPIPPTGFGTTASKLAGRWDSMGPSDHLSILDAANHCLNVRATGLYRLHCQLTLPVGATTGRISAGSLVRYALIDDDGEGRLSVVTEGASLTADAGGIHVLQMNAVSAHLVAGHRIWISLMADGQNGPCHLTFQTDPSAANVLELALLPPD